MGINVSASTGHLLDNSENLKNAAKHILNKGGASAEATEKIIATTLFSQDAQIKELYTNPQVNILKASAQITLNNSLKETLKYLRSQANKKVVKQHVLGELWGVFTEIDDQQPYEGELCNFEIDKNTKNIFAA